MNNAIIYDAPTTCFVLNHDGLVEVKTCKRDIINNKLLFVIDLKFVGLNNYYYLAGCTMFPHLPAPI